MKSTPSNLSGSKGAVAATLALVLLVGGLAACDAVQLPDRTEHPPPAASELEGYYSFPSGSLEFGMSGNVAQLAVTVDPDPFYRGGDLWAKSLPYLFIFSQGTRDALDEHEGLGGIRVRVLHPGGDVMAEALLRRGDMTQRDWREALSIAGLARREGTERPGRMVALVRWGEDHTEFEYNPEYISPDT
ncbi:MAG: hypothetical protein EA351_12640 [Gemmatimonadales bacterium]|nr:MAG: hypothetical protein EA351_12640 [Gemmatimonadales bacterium]